jgi:hypothetical protein
VCYPEVLFILQKNKLFVIFFSKLAQNIMSSMLVCTCIESEGMTFYENFTCLTHGRHQKLNSSSSVHSIIHTQESYKYVKLCYPKSNVFSNCRILHNRTKYKSSQIKKLRTYIPRVQQCVCPLPNGDPPPPPSLPQASASPPEPNGGRH